MHIKHVDSGFYLLTRDQAIALAYDHKLPKDGFQKRAVIGDDVVLLHRAGGDGSLWVERPLDKTNLSGWIQLTKVSWHDGQFLKDPWVWSIYFRPQGIK